MAEAELSLIWQGTRERGRMLRASWRAVGSALVFGRSGFGKSTTQMHIGFQAARQGQGLVIADPHGGQEEGIAARLLPLVHCYWKPAAFGMDESLRRILDFERELDRRIERGADHMRETGEPWAPEADHDLRLLLIVDELNGLIQEHRGKVAKPLSKIAQQGRKYGMFAILSGQWATVQALGSSELRAAYTSVIVHLMSPLMAARLTSLPQAHFPLAEGLAKGEAYVKLGEGPLALHPARGRVPQITPAELARVAGTIPPLREPAPLRVVDQRLPVRASPATTAKVWGERERVLALFREGRTTGDIGVMVQGLSLSTQGRSRTEGARVVEDILRAELERSA